MLNVTISQANFKGVLTAMILYPFVWLLLLPFRLVGIAMGGVFELIKALIFLPARVPGARP